MTEKVPSLKSEIDLSPERTEDQSEPMSENFEVQQEYAREQLHDSFYTLLRSAMGRTCAHSGEEGFSGNAASIYAITSLKNEKGEEVPELVKIGWGEFSKETFESGRYPAFHEFPLDIFCVSQSDSYFAEGQLREDMLENPARYLQEHSLFVANNGKVKLSEEIDWRNRHLNQDIQATPYEDMLCAIRNQIIRVNTTPEEFATFLHELPDDPSELDKYMSDLEHRVGWLNDSELQAADEKTREDVRKKSLMHILWGMGVKTFGIAVGDEKAMESILVLKKQFDFETNSFRK